MATSASPRPLPPSIRSLLSGLRWRIRAYVWLEGITLAFVWVGIMFWTGLAFDYLPILVGASEMPVAARAVLLGIIGVVLAWILYRWILRRTFVRLADHSMAVLLERRFGQFHDSLVTSVELHENPDRIESFSDEMVEHTNHEALDGLPTVRLRNVFNFAPLALGLFGAVVIAASLGGFAATYPEALQRWAKRLFLLDPEPWPRSTEIQIVGVEIERPIIGADGSTETILLPFSGADGRSVKVGKGSNVTLLVQANAEKRLPDNCTIYYRTADGDRNRVSMTKIAGVRPDGFQRYSFDGKPFRGILSDVAFDVVGYDHRVKDYLVNVVRTPAVTATNLDCEFPDYMVDEQSGKWTPRTMQWLNGLRLPKGTKVTINCTSTKQLQRAVFYNPETKEKVEVKIAADATDPTQAQFVVDNLKNDTVLDVVLFDRDRVMIDQPHRIVITAVDDQAPKVSARLKGIGMAVTPDVIIPIKGNVSDDYGVASNWLELSRNDGDVQKVDYQLAKGGKIDQQIDFRVERSKKSPLAIKPNDKLVLVAKSADHFNLNGARPNVGNGDRYEFDVVTANQLLVLLEAREIGLRRRFEQIISEVTQTRDQLVRVRSEARGDEPKAETPEERSARLKKEKSLSPAEKEKKKNESLSIQTLRIQQATQDCAKAEQEVLGVGVQFAEIRAELINNRVDSKDRQTRIKEKISDPLIGLAKNEYPQLNKHLRAIEKLVGTPEFTTGVEDSVKQLDGVLLKMNNILEHMRNIETYNELIGILRSIMEDQQKMIQKTKTQQKKRLLDLFDEDEDK